MPAVLVQIDGYDPVAPVAVTLRASSVDDDRVCHLDGANGTWWPAIAELPELRYDLVDAAFSGRVDTPSSQIVLAVEPFPNLPRYQLSDARVRIWTGNAGDAWGSYTLRFDGRCTAQPNIADGRASLTIAVDDRWLDTPLLALYAGTTGAEGDAALKGQPKPLSIGAPRFAPGRLIDGTNLVVQLSTFQIEDVEVAFERILRFGASAGDYASYAALVAATIPAGQWATAKAVGMVRHGAPPVPGGRFVYHLKGDKAGPDGWVRLPGSIIKRLALIAGGSGRFSEASMDALDAARPWNTSWHFTEQITAREAIQRIAASVNAVAGVSWLSQLFVAPLPSLAGSPAVTLDTSGATLPPVGKVEQIPMDPPFWRMSIETEKTWDVHQYSDIAFTAVLVDRGNYSGSETYREGNIVQDQSSSWLYINPTPASGNAPPTLPTSSNSYWRLLASVGPTGATGATGAAGLNTAVVFIFRRAASTPSMPSATTTYTFATGVLTGLNNSWQQTVPAADGNPLYVSVATASSAGATDTIGIGEWAAAVIQSQDGATGATGATGAAGLNVASVFLYKRASSTPALPSTTSTFTFATGVLTGHNNGWTQSVPAVDGNPLYVTTATASATGSTDTIANTEWAAAAIMAQDGATGATGATGAAGLNNAVVYLYQRGTSAPALPSGSAATYTFATGVLSGGTMNGWTQAIPASDGNPLWVTAATASSNTATDTIAAAEWAAAVQQEGAGLNAATVFLFKRTISISSPAVPSATTTYTFSTAVLASINNGWSQTMPADTDGNWLWVTTATATGAGTTDTIATGEWATPRLVTDNATIVSISNILEPNVLDRQEKSSELLPRIAELGARYTQVTSRATALGISTSSASTARTNFLNYLAGLSPTYDDVKQDTTLVTNGFADFNFPTGWTSFGGTATANGIYTTVTDASAGGFDGRYRLNATITPSQTCTAAIVVKKDAVAASTRSPVLRVYAYTAGHTVTGDIQFDTSTGAYGLFNTASAGGVYDLNDTEWLVWVSVVAGASDTLGQIDLYPAAGTGVAGSYSAATTGSIDVRSPVLVVGTIDKAGRDALNYRLRAYGNELDKLDKAVSEMDGTTSLQIDGPAALTIDATTAGDASGSLPIDLGYVATVGSASVTSSATWSRTVLSASGSVTCTIGAATGLLDITALATTSATVRIDCTYGGVTKSKTLTITRNDALPATGGGGTSASASATSFSTINSTTFTTIATLTITAGSAGPSLSASALSCTPSGAIGSVGGPWNVEMKWVRENGVTDVDVGSTANSSPDPEVANDGEGHPYKISGAITCNATDSGRSVGVQYIYYLQAKLTSGSRTIGFTGTASVTS